MMNHPIHIVLAHFPAALFPFAFVLDLLSVLALTPDYSALSQVVLIAGLSMGGLAIVFGTIDILAIPTKHPSYDTAVKHALINFTVLMVFLMLFLLKPKIYETGGDWLWLSLLVLTNAGLFLGNFLGGKLVLEHGVGTRFFETEK